MTKAEQGQVCVQSAKGNLSFQLPTVYAQYYYNSKQKYISFGGKDNQENRVLATANAFKMQKDLELGKFEPDNVSCYKHPNKQVKGRFQVKTEALFNALELYQDFVKHLDVSITTMSSTYRTHRNHLEEMENACGYTLKQQLEIKTWIQSNIASHDALKTLSLLHRMIEWGKREERLPDTFVSKFRDYSIEFRKSLKNKNIDRKLPKSAKALIPREGIKAWSEQERDIIIAAFYSRKRYISKVGTVNYIAPLVEFLFNVGCRHGEAFAVTWGDITNNFTFVNIDKSYSGELKITKGTKTGKNRLVPLNSKAQEILKNLKPVNALSSELIFKNKNGVHLQSASLNHYWNPKRNTSVIGNLIKQGELSTYLDFYSTRRTFASIQISKGASVADVAYWMGDTIETVIKHYVRHNHQSVPF